MKYHNQLNFEETRQLAYQLWQDANCPSGEDINFWLQAEQQLAGNREEQFATNLKETGSSKSNVKRVITPTSNGSTKRQPANKTKLATNSKPAGTSNSNLKRATKPSTSGASTRPLTNTKKPSWKQ